MPPKQVMISQGRRRPALLSTERVRGCAKPAERGHDQHRVEIGGDDLFLHRQVRAGGPPHGPRGRHRRGRQHDTALS